MVVTVTTGPTNLRIYQRSNEAQRSAIRVIGAYVGTGVTAEYKITEGARIVQNWKTFGAVSVAPGSYEGYMVNVPCGTAGAWYTLHVQILDGAGAVVDSVALGHSWSVGIIVLGAGQSLLSEWNTNGAAAVWQAGTSVTDQAGTYSQPAAGQGATAFCKALSNLTGVPVALANLAVSGSALRKEYVIVTGYWYPDDATSHANLLLRPFSQVDSIECMIWCQGETDAVKAELIYNKEARAYHDYTDDFKHFVDNVYSLFGATFIYTIPIGRCEIGIIANKEHAGVRDALADRVLPLIRYAATHYDLDHGAANTDIYHLTPAEYEVLATRTAYQIAYNQFGIKEHGRVTGPWIDRAVFPYPNNLAVVDVHIDGIRNGLEFNGAATLTHWIAHLSNGVEAVAPASVALYGNVVRLTFAAPLGSDYLISYCYGTGIATAWNTGGVQDTLRTGILTNIPLQTLSNPIPIKQRTL